MKFKKVSYSALSFWIGIIILAFLGYFFQFSGLLTPTECNFIVLFLFLISYQKWLSTRWVVFNSEGMMAGLFFCSILFSAFLNSNPIYDFLVYLYYFIAFFFSVKVAGKFSLAPYLYRGQVWRNIILFMFFQVLVVILQGLFSDKISAVSKTVVAVVDAKSGTFYMSSDSSLVFSSILVMIASFCFDTKKNIRLLVILASFMLSWGAGSKAGFVVFFIVLAVLIVYGLLEHFGICFRNFYVVFFGFFVSVLSYILMCFFSPFDEAFLYFLSESFYYRDIVSSSNRFAVLGYLFFEEVDFFGRGLLTYYNPLTKDWFYYGGFGTVYSLYLDLGLVGLLSFYLFITFYVFRHVESVLFASLYVFVFFIFSFFNFVFTDLLFVTLFFLLVNANKFGRPYV